MQLHDGQVGPAEDTAHTEGARQTENAQPRSTAERLKGARTMVEAGSSTSGSGESRQTRQLALLKDQIARRKEVEEALKKESARVKLLQKVAIAANEAQSTNEALQLALTQIAEHLGWPFGHIYKLSPEGNGQLVSGDIWYCIDEKRFAGLIQATKSTSFSLGEGWLGQAAAEGVPVWSADLSQEPLFVRRHKGEDLVGVKGGVALPILAESEIAVVLEFFSPDATAPEADFLDLMTHVSTQLGRLIERQRAQERLVREETLLAQAERIAQLGSWEWDLVSSAVTWSDELYRIYGIDRHEFGASYEDFLTRVHPEDRERVTETIQASVDGGRPFHFHHRIVRPDGEVRVLFGQGRPVFNDEGKVVRLFGTGQDVSEQIRLQKKMVRQAEQLQALQEMGHAVTSTFERKVIFEEVLDKLMDLLGAQGVFVLLLQGDELVFAASNQAGEDDPTGRRVPADTGVAGEVLKAGKALALFGDEAKRRTFGDFVRALGYRPGALLVAPLRLRGNIIGVLEAMHRRADGFGEDDLQILEVAASWTAIAVQNARLFDQLRSGRERLRQLARQVVIAQEVERRRISHELHDEAGQALTALKINLDMIRASLPPEQEEVQQKLAEAVDTADQTMEKIRRLAHGLHPPVLDKFGLRPAIEGLCDDFASKTHLDIQAHVDPLPSLDDQLAISLYRVLQEALTNVVKHADATGVDVALIHEGNSIELSVSDDGQGFVPAVEKVISPGGMGLAGMQERVELLGGELYVDSRPGQGTRIVVRVPHQGEKGDEA
jgi:PAS domain S-box-containing protein